MGAKKENRSRYSISESFSTIVLPALEEAFSQPYPYLLKFLRVSSVNGNSVTLESEPYVSGFIAKHFGGKIKDEIEKVVGGRIVLTITE